MPTDSNMISPCPFSRGYKIPTTQAWFLLKGFYFYRLILSCLFLALYYSQIGKLLIEPAFKQLYLYTSLTYLIITIAGWIFIIKRWPSYASQAQLLVFSDVLLITLIMHSCGGIESGIGALMLVSTVAGGLLIGGRCAMLFAAIASLFVFSEHAYSQKRTVLVLSLDGVGFNYLQSQDLPSFNRLKKEGIRGKLKPVFQSTTFPAHASMATGVYPDRHGILHNIFFDRDKGKYSYSGDTNWFDVPPIWILAEQQSIKSALYYWIGSETDWRGTIPTLRKIPFNNKIDETKKINQIIDWLDSQQSNLKPGKQ